MLFSVPCSVGDDDDRSKAEVPSLMDGIAGLMFSLAENKSYAELSDLVPAKQNETSSNNRRSMYSCIDGRLAAIE